MKITYKVFENIANLLIAAAGFLYLLSYYFLDSQTKFIMSFVILMVIPFLSASFFLISVSLRFHRRVYDFDLLVSFILNLPSLVIVVMTLITMATV